MTPACFSAPSIGIPADQQVVETALIHLGGGSVPKGGSGDGGLYFPVESGFLATLLILIPAAEPSLAKNSKASGIPK